MWAFCARSVFREYGWRFFRRVAARRPWRTLCAISEADRLAVAGRGVIDVAGGLPAEAAARPPAIVGAGFCLKPINPPCPSGRASHGCWFLETIDGDGPASVPLPCRACAIREIGTRALRAGSAFYVMTSARDILDDVYVPALRAGRYPTGLFVLCRYSFKPFAAGLLASGMRARLLPLEQGDCRDYRTWLLADRGVKTDQTTVDAAGMRAVAGALGESVPSTARRVERRGNVMHPVIAGPPA
jgi:hypothetical protein